MLFLSTLESILYIINSGYSIRCFYAVLWGIHPDGLCLLFFVQQHGCLGGNALFLSHKPEALRGGGLDIHPVE